MFNFRFEEHFNLGRYIKQLKCYSAVMMPGKQRKDVDKGGKIILPASALDHLTRLHIQFPMLFKLTNKSKQTRTTHCGVLEFIADEGLCYLPHWMMKNLLVNEGDLITVEYVNLDIARFAKFQPQSVDFLEISNPKAVLENSLRNFACLTKGDVISINYNDKDYELCILETRPGDAVSIIECDMDVDFAPPVGYQEPTYSKPQTSGIKKNPITKPPEKTVSEGQRLDGKQKKRTDQAQAEKAKTSSTTDTVNQTRGVPFYDYPIGLLRFHHDIINEQESMETEQPKEPELKGHKLKHIGVKI